MIKRKKIIITGATGKLGSRLVPYLKENYKIYPVSFSKKKGGYFKLDLTDENVVNKKINTIKPDIIIHLASLTNVDECEKDFIKAYKINIGITSNLVNATKKENKQIRFIYISTDQIYNKLGYNKEEESNPCNNYAITKYVSENIVKNLSNFLIIRTNFYGFFPKHKDSLINWFLKEYKFKKRINLIKDIFFNPLYVDDLIDVLLRMLENKKTRGIYNLGSKDKISKANLLLKIAKFLGYKKEKFNLIKVKKLNLIAYRPKYMVMNVKKIEKKIKISLPRTDFGLIKLVNEIKNY